MTYNKKTKLLFQMNFPAFIGFEFAYNTFVVDVFGFVSGIIVSQTLSSN